MLHKTKEFYDFITERESIRLRKAAGSPFPWTKDPILREYKFTNVRREHDKTTQKLIEMFYSKEGQTESPYEILFNCALFRYFGTYEFAAAVEWQDSFQPRDIISLARNRLNVGARVFTGAYLITNVGLKGPKEEIVVNVFLKNLWNAKANIILMVANTNSWQKTSEALRKIQGFGGTGFMAKETLLDTMHCDFWKGGKPSDYWTWTPIGPGGRRGINRVMGLEPDARTSEEDMLKAIIELTSEQENHWQKEWGKLAPTDVQFQLCEFYKYCKVQSGEGRPRSRYRANQT